MSKIIRCKIAKKTGAMTVEAEGYTGQSCLEATAKLEQGLGLTVENREAKSEMYIEEQQQQGLEGS